MRTSHLRSVLAVAIVCAAATWASAQVRVVVPGRLGGAFPAPRLGAVPAPSVSVETVVAHVLKFDVDGDGHVRAGELPERMIPLIGRGDRNGDQALDADEVAAVVRNPLPLGRGRLPVARVTSGQGVLSGQGTDPPRRPPPPGPEALVRELKLPAPRTEAAVAVLAKRRTTGPTFGGVLTAQDVDEATLRKLAGILTKEELADFKAAVARQVPLFRGRGVVPPAPSPQPPRPQVRLKAPAFARSAPARPRRSLGGGGDTTK